MSSATIASLLEYERNNGNRPYRVTRRLLSGDRLIHITEHFPKIVCLCGSTRFGKAFQDANLAETLAGNIVLTIGCDTKSDDQLSAALLAHGSFETIKEELDALHRRKIDLCDEVLVLNVGGYIGESTRSEIVYAEAIGKHVRYLEARVSISSGEIPC